MDLIHIHIGTAALIGLMGYLVVFLGLFLLMLVVSLLGGIMKRKTDKPQATAPALTEKPKTVVAEPSEAKGEVELYGVHPRDAAMIMAIVADGLGKPLDTLHFKSIKEVEDR